MEKQSMNILNKKIILHGNEKIQKDFKFLFQELNIVKEDIPGWEKNFKERPQEYLVVACDKKINPDIENLVQKTESKQDKIVTYIEDFFLYYNPMFLKRGNRKLAVWGTGAAANELWEVLDKKGISDEIDFFVDNSREKITFKERKVLSPGEIKGRNDIYIIVAAYHCQWEIYKQLEEYGFSDQKDYIHYTSVSRDYGELLRKVCFSEKKYSCHCSRPTGYCDVISGELYLCCPDFLPISAGNMRLESFMRCWDSYIARILRLSVLNGTFVFCNKQYCDLFDFDENSQEKSEYEFYGVHSRYPNTLMVGIDYSCNLKCPSCREDTCIANAGERIEMNRQAEDLLEHVIPYVGRLWMAGSGEVFFSRIYRKMLEDERCRTRKSISILSNGTLFDEEKWKLLEKSWQSVEVVISMDGIKDETIEKLRRGADAQKLKKNLNFLGGLRRKNKIQKLFLSCVIQADNVSELYELLEYCRAIGVDKVQFLKMKNNGIYSDATAFDKMSIFDGRDCLKDEYRKYFTEKLLRHPLADWFNSARTLGVEKKPRLDQYDTL